MVVSEAMYMPLSASVGTILDGDKLAYSGRLHV
ncbi:MAG: hypothetical protein ACI8VC_002911 [Candidatus Endobugula sp.]